MYLKKAVSYLTFSEEHFLLLGFESPLNQDSYRMNTKEHDKLFDKLWS